MHALAASSSSEAVAAAEEWLAVERFLVALYAAPAAAGERRAVPLAHWLGACSEPLERTVLLRHRMSMVNAQGMLFDVDAVGDAQPGPDGTVSVTSRLYAGEIVPYLHGLQLERWLQALRRDNAHASALACGQPLGLAGRLLAPAHRLGRPPDAAHARRRVAQELAALGRDAEAAALEEALQRIAAAAPLPAAHARAERPKIADIEDLHRHLPPCMAAPVAHARQTGGKMTFDARFPVANWLAAVTTPEVQEHAFAFLTGTAQHSANADLWTEIKSAYTKAKPMGCNTVRARGAQFPSGLCKCPYADSAACAQDAGLPDGVRLHSPADFIYHSFHRR